MRKYISIAALIILFISISVNIVSANERTVSPSSHRILIDGRPVALLAYNIDGNNFFRLRDLAFVLSQTGSQFDIGWNAAANVITITTRREYIAIGSEMNLAAAQNSIATPTAANIQIDGAAKSLTGFLIDGSNFFYVAGAGRIAEL